MENSSGFDSESVREDEREIETKAAYSGKGALGGEDAGQYMMPNVEKDGAEAMCQRAANAARDYNQRGDSSSENEPGEGTGTEVY